MLRLGPIQGFPSACPANLVAQHKSSLVFRFDGRLAQNGDWEVSLAEVGFFCCRLAQCELRGFVSSEGLLLPTRRADFYFNALSMTSAGLRVILRSGMPLCVTGAGHRTLFHPCGRRCIFARCGSTVGRRESK